MIEYRVVDRHDEDPQAFTRSLVAARNARIGLTRRYPETEWRVQSREVTEWRDVDGD